MPSISLGDVVLGMYVHPTRGWVRLGIRRVFP
jgi:hypothetical protein